MFRNNSGFTLLETLIALVISAIIAVGVYSLFSSVVSVKESTEKNDLNTAIVLNLKKIFKKDMIQMYEGTVSVDKTENNYKISFSTNHSLKFDNGTEVKVTYYIQDGRLIREESNTDMDYDWELKLLPDVSDFTVLADNGYKMVDSFTSTQRIFQISLKYGDRKERFIAGCGYPSSESIENTSSSTTSNDDE